jgi:hypothetical protein
MAETGILRHPTATFNGIIILECEVIQLGSQGDGTSTFEVVMALDDPTNPGASYWAGAQGISGSISGDNGDGSGSNVLITGDVDYIIIDFGPRTVRVHGRGKEGKLADTRNDQNYVNQSIASVLSQVAGKAGLGLTTTAPNVGNMAGHTYDKQNYNFITDKENNWDTIQNLAEQAAGRAFVFGSSLFVMAPGTGMGSYLVTYVPPTPESYDESNAVRIICRHDTTVSGAEITATSTHSHDKETYTAGGGGGGASVPGAGSPL